MNATTAGLTVWLRVHRKGRQPGRWLQETYASRDKMQRTIEDFKSLHTDVDRVEVSETRP